MREVVVVRKVVAEAPQPVPDDIFKMFTHFLMDTHCSLKARERSRIIPRYLKELEDETLLPSTLMLRAGIHGPNW